MYSKDIGTRSFAHVDALTFKSKINLKIHMRPKEICKFLYEISLFLGGGLGVGGH